MFRSLYSAPALWIICALSSATQTAANPPGVPTQASGHPAPSASSQSSIETASTPPVDSAVKAAPAFPAPGARSLAASALVTPTNFLGQALALYRNGDFPAAIGKFQEVLRGDAKSPDPYAWLARSYLRQKNVDLALETVNKGLAMNDCPRVRVALGEVYFRQGKIHEAEREWVQVVNAGYPEPRAFLGLYRVRNALAMFKQGKAMIDRAHDLSSSDPEITKEWIDTLQASGPDQVPRSLPGWDE